MDFITVFSFIVFLVLVPFAATGIHWLGARAGELIQAKVKNERLRAALLRLEDAVVTAGTSSRRSWSSTASWPGTGSSAARTAAA